MIMRLKLVHALAGILTSGALVTVQPQVPVAIDPAPLARPASLTVYQTGDAPKVYRSVAKLLTDSGYSLKQLDPTVGELEATRGEGDASGGFDRLVIWLERDFDKPTEYIRLYLLFGRYAKVFGHTEPMRIKLTATDEANRVGKLKQALLSLSF
jgi:hypothetical protein